MTKTQQWANAQTILSSLELSKPKYAIALEAFRELLEPKKAGGASRPEPKMIDEVKYYYCRFTGRYWKAEEMVYQNDAKREKLDDKGYSKSGISLWNKGQKYLKDLQTKSVEMAYGIGYDNNDPEVFKEGKKLMEEANTIKAANSANDFKWLVENMAAESYDLFSSANSVA